MDTSEWQSSRWVEGRSQYRYPPARLVISTTLNAALVSECGLALDCDQSLIASNASVELDGYHKALLNSDVSSDRLTGLLSVAYWGYYASADYPHRKPTPALALTRAARILNGRKGGVRPVMAHTRKALDQALHYSAANQIALALKELMSIDYLGMSFASKVLMFSDPDRAVVYDKVIAKQIARFATKNHTWQTMAVSALGKYTIEKGKAYEAWCNYCREQADALNGQGAHWNDTHNQRRQWQAVDVERTLFSLTRPQ